MFRKIIRLGKKKNLSRFKLLRDLYDKFIRIEFPYSLKIQGVKMRHAQLRFWIDGYHEKGTTDFIFSKLKKGDTFIDVGTHFGYYTAIAASIVEDSGVVYSFEPSPRNFQCLKDTVKANKFDNVICENSAVSNKTEDRFFYISGSGTGIDSLIKSDVHNNKVKVKAVSLDDYFKEISLQNINMVKIDAEGADIEVLEGMKKIIDFNPDINIIVEFSPKNILQTSDYGPAEFLDQLNSMSLDYKILENVDIKNKQELVWHATKNGHVNLLCTKSIISQV